MEVNLLELLGIVLLSLGLLSRIPDGWPPAARRALHRHIRDLHHDFRFGCDQALGRL